jgi:hypothetical protein
MHVSDFLVFVVDGANSHHNSSQTVSIGEIFSAFGVAGLAFTFRS